MPEEQQAEEVNDQPPVPVFETAPEIDDSQMAEPAEPAEQPRRRRGRPPKKQVRESSGPRIGPELGLTKKQGRSEAGRKSHATRDMDYDTWVQQFPWEWPGMVCKLNRISPQYVNQTMVSGYLEQRANQPYLEDEIKKRFGGGRYEVRIIGPREEGDPKTYCINRKQFDVGGKPNLESLPHDSSKPQQPSVEVGAQAQSSLVSILGDELKRAHHKGESGGSGGGEAIAGMQEAYSESRTAIQASTQAQVQAIRDSSARETEAIRTQLEGVRQELERERAESKIREQALQERAQDAGSSANSLMQTLFPSVNQSAQAQVAEMRALTDQQLQRQESTHKSDTEGLHRFYQTQIESQKTLFQVQDSQTRSTFDNQTTLLQGQLQILQAKNDLLEKDNNKLRDQIMTVHQERAAKQDPIRQMENVQQLVEVAKSLGGGGDSGGDLGDDVPDYMKLLNNALPAIGNVTEIIKGRIGGAQQPMPQQEMAGLPPGMSPEQYHAQMAAMQQAQAQQAQAQQTAMVPVGPQQSAPVAPARKKSAAAKVRIKRADLENAVGQLNAIMHSGTGPDRAAEAAISNIPGDTLKALSIRPPERVIAELEQAGIIKDEMASDESKQYITAFLVHLKEKLTSDKKPE
jgi:hypothetical protein